MASLDARTPVGRLVTENLGRAGVFTHLGIDYCCGGQTPLDQACREKGLDLDDVLRELALSDARGSETDRVDWSGATMGAIADHIVAVHHAYLRRELPVLIELADKVVRAHGERHSELRAVRDALADLKEALEFHMYKEENILFPIIKQLETATSLPGFHCGSVNNPILVMESEHQDAGAVLERFRALTGGYEAPADACNTYRALLDGLARLEADMHRHVHLENEILFPRASAAEAALSATAALSGLR